MFAKQNERLMTVDELAERWQVEPAWVYKKAKDPDFPTIRLGGNIRFAFEDIEEYEKQAKENDSARRRRRGY
jgi:excisionase family DNA binding protein